MPDKEALLKRIMLVLVCLSLVSQSNGHLKMIGKSSFERELTKVASRAGLLRKWSGDFRPPD